MQNIVGVFLLSAKNNKEERIIQAWALHKYKIIIEKNYSIIKVGEQFILE